MPFVPGGNSHHFLYHWSQINQFCSLLPGLRLLAPRVHSVFLVICVSSWSPTAWWPWNNMGTSHFEPDNTTWHKLVYIPHWLTAGPGILQWSSAAWVIPTSHWSVCPFISTLPLASRAPRDTRRLKIATQQMWGEFLSQDSAFWWMKFGGSSVVD
jgi:hypothetical protein